MDEAQVLGAVLGEVVIQLSSFRRDPEVVLPRSEHSHISQRCRGAGLRAEVLGLHALALGPGRMR
ncbi:hypothetical protein GCM10027269_46710 [Kribbella endophytica]